MKKIICILIMWLMVIGLVGCGSKEEKAVKDSVNTSTNSSTTNKATNSQENSKENKNVSEIESKVTPKINIFESSDIWGKYVNGDYTGQKIEFAGEVMNDGIGSGTLDGSNIDVYLIYTVSYKVADNKYYMCTIAAHEDDRLKKGDSVSGWGLILDGEVLLGSPTVTVLGIDKK